MKLSVEQARRDAIGALDALASGGLDAKRQREACEAFVESLRYIALADMQEALWPVREFMLAKK